MKYLNLGKKIAQKSNHNFKHSSLVIKGGKVLSFGHNHDDIHSEVNALKDLWPKNRKGSIVINFRIGKDNSLRNSYPCEDCLEYCKKVGVRKVIYSTGWSFSDFFIPTSKGVLITTKNMTFKEVKL